MTGLPVVVTERLEALVRVALQAAIGDGSIPPVDDVAIEFDRPKRREHGDWSTNVALTVAGGRSTPRDIAQAVVERLPPSEIVDKVEVAGPGFINFHLSAAWLHDVVRRAAAPAGRFGQSDEGRGASVNVEYVSANPTGPVNVVSGRHAAVGDAISNLLEAIGFTVTREFYVNDAGRQMRLFARSVAVRYLRALGVDADLPEDGYQGNYVVDLARDLVEEVGTGLLSVSEAERDAAVGEWSLKRMLESMRRSLERFGTRFEVWSRESELRESGEVSAALERLEAGGWLSEREGALWFESSRLGDDKDRPVVRSDGEPTYLASDCAYLLDKFDRGFDRLIYLWGADHHGTVPRLLAAAEALGFDRARVEVPIVQNITLLRRGRVVKASKRLGFVDPLDDLVDEVGADAARFTFLTRSLDAPLEFDIELAKDQAPENPVYYVQYAHARICSILRRAQQQSIVADAASAPLGRLGHASEDELMRKLASYEEVVPEAARARAPQKVVRYAEELAAVFSRFYRDCRVVSDDAELSRARLALCLATREVIARALGLLAVGAPESM